MIDLKEYPAKLLEKRALMRIAGWAILVFAGLVLGVPLIVHVVHLGVLVVKLVVEVAIISALFALGIWLVRK